MRSRRLAGAALLAALLPAVGWGQITLPWSKPSGARGPTPPRPFPATIQPTGAPLVTAPPGPPPPNLAPAPPPRAEGLTTFDPRTVQVRRRDGRWTVEANEVLLKDCGNREEEA